MPTRRLREWAESRGVEDARMLSVYQRTGSAEQDEVLRWVISGAATTVTKL
jgi:hypothetical protein